MDGGVAAGGGPEDVVGVGDVAGDDLDTEGGSGSVSAPSRARARTASPRSIRSLQTLAPASPVAPVTRTVSLMPAPVRDGSSLVGRVVDLIGAVGDDRWAGAEHVEGVDEAVSPWRWRR